MLPAPGRPLQLWPGTATVMWPTAPGSVLTTGAVSPGARSVVLPPSPGAMGLPSSPGSMQLPASPGAVGTPTYTTSNAFVSFSPTRTMPQRWVTGSSIAGSVVVPSVRTATADVPQATATVATEGAAAQIPESAAQQAETSSPRHSSPRHGGGGTGPISSGTGTISVGTTPISGYTAAPPVYHTGVYRSASAGQLPGQGPSAVWRLSSTNNNSLIRSTSAKGLSINEMKADATKAKSNDSVDAIIHEFQLAMRRNLDDTAKKTGDYSEAPVGLLASARTRSLDRLERSSRTDSPERAPLTVRSPRQSMRGQLHLTCSVGSLKEAASIGKSGRGGRRLSDSGRYSPRCGGSPSQASRAPGELSLAVVAQQEAALQSADAEALRRKRRNSGSAQIPISSPRKSQPMISPHDKPTAADAVAGVVAGAHDSLTATKLPNQTKGERSPRSSMRSMLR